MEILPGGLWPVMLTPFKDNNELDLYSLEMLTEFYIKAGAQGLFANCLSSEMFQLSEKERLTIIKIVLESTSGKLPVIATGTFSKDENINVEFIEKVFDLGINAVIINSNQLNDQSENEDAFKSNLESLSKKTDNIPLGIYECPVPYKRLISPPLLKWLAKSERFLYMKDTCSDIQMIEKKLDAIKGTKLSLYNANIPTGLPSLKKGAKGLSPIGANYFPEIYSYLARNFEDPQKAESINKLNNLLCSVDTLVHALYPLSAKWFLQKRGLKIGLTTRTPVSSMIPKDFIKLESLKEVLTNISVELGIDLVI